MFFFQKASFPRGDDTHKFTCIFTGLSFDNSAQATTALLRKGGDPGSLLLRTTEAVHPEEAAGTDVQVRAGEEEHRPPGLSLSGKSPVTGSRHSGVSQTYHLLRQESSQLSSLLLPHPSLLQTALRQLASGCIPQRPSFGACRRCLKTFSS